MKLEPADTIPLTGPIIPEQVLELFANGNRKEAIVALKHHYSYYSSADVLCAALLDLGTALWQMQANIAHLQETTARLSQMSYGHSDVYTPRACYYCGISKECVHR